MNIDLALPMRVSFVCLCVRISFVIGSCFHLLYHKCIEEDSTNSQICREHDDLLWSSSLILARTHEKQLDPNQCFFSGSRSIIKRIV